MNHAALLPRAFAAFALLAAVVARAQLAAPSRVEVDAPAVELPPMLVAEKADAPPWYYANVNGTEYLSRCSTATTRDYAEHWERALQRLWTIVPDRLLPRRELASITLLHSQRLAQSSNPELIQALKQIANTARRGLEDFGQDPFFRFAPNMRLNDRDEYATFAYLDEFNFAAERMTVAPALLRYLLERRVPALPGWFVQGTLAVYQGTSFAPDEVTLPILFWVDRVQTNGLALDADYPRALLPANELFAHDALRGNVNGNFRRRETLAAQATLFIRWALETGPATREALWRFAERTAEEPPTEEIFAACFGFGYAELRDRLSDFLPQAVKQTGRFVPGKPGRLPRVSVRRATPSEIARLRGTWERLAATFVQRQSPALYPRYVDEARRTLRRAFDAGDRDPRLWRELGLCELEADDRFTALPLLETAMTASPRARTGYEVARLRFEELRRRDPEKSFSAAELEPVLSALRSALQQPPLLPEAFALLGRVGMSCHESLTAPDLALLEAGARAFARNPQVSLQVGNALARQGRTASAARLFAVGAEYAPDAASRARFVELLAALDPSPAPTRAANDSAR